MGDRYLLVDIRVVLLTPWVVFWARLGGGRLGNALAEPLPVIKRCQLTQAFSRLLGPR